MLAAASNEWSSLGLPTGPSDRIWGPIPVNYRDAIKKKKIFFLYEMGLFSFGEGALDLY